MPTYRKRPVEITAVRWDGENWEEVLAAFPEVPTDVAWDIDSHSLIVRTLEGRMRCAQGDWLIRGVKGEFYPCKDDIFQSTYEAVDVLETE